MTPAELAEMLRRDEAEWSALVGVLDSHPGGPVHDPESPEWEARHVYAHLARWLTQSMDDFEAVLAGRPRPVSPEGDDDSVNARWRAEDQTVSFAEARGRCHEAWTRRLRLLEGQSDWTPLLEAIARADGYEHIGAHRGYIEQALGDYARRDQ